LWCVRRLMGKVASDKCHKWVFKEPSDCEPNISNYWQSSFDAVTIYSFIYFYLISTLLLLYSLLSLDLSSPFSFFIYSLLRLSSDSSLWFPQSHCSQSQTVVVAALEHWNRHLHASAPASACNVLFDYLRFWSLSCLLSLSL
jgi:hypothetical protein